MANSATFFRDVLLIKRSYSIQDAVLSKSSPDWVSIPWVSRSRAHRIWIDDELADQVETVNEEWYIDVDLPNETVAYEGRFLEASNGPLPLYVLASTIDAQGKQLLARTPHMLYPKSYTARLKQPGSLKIFKPELKKYKTLTVTYENQRVDWQFSHLLRFSETKTPLLETVIEFSGFDTGESERLLFDELRFVNRDYVTQAPAQERRYGERSLRASAKRESASAPTDSSNVEMDASGDWVLSNIEVMRNRTLILRASHYDMPAELLHVYYYNGLEHGNPEIWIDMTSEECQKVLQHIEAGSLSIYGAKGQHLSQGGQLDTQTKRIKAGKFKGISVKCKRTVDNLEKRYHDEVFDIINKTKEDLVMWIWQPDTIRVQIGDTDGPVYEPTLDLELQTSIVKVPIPIAPGQHQVKYRWFHL